MKLKEVLKNHMGENVKLGASSSFVYCGMADAGIFETVEMLSQKELQKKAKAFETRKRKGHIYFMKRWSEKLNRGLRRLRYEATANGWTKEQVEARTKEFFKDFEQRKERDRQRVESGEDVAERLQGWVGFLDRKVKEVYEGFDGETIIIFEGNELGAYWTFEEYERGWADDEGDIL